MRTARARRIAAAAAFGGGGVGALTALGYAILRAEAVIAKRIIGSPFGERGPDSDGVFGHGPGRPRHLVMLGDSVAAGLGVEYPGQTPGAVLASGLAALSGHPVRFTSVAVVGAESSWLAAQVDRVVAGIEEFGAPDVAVIVVGGNDVTHQVHVPDAVAHLAQAVTRLRELGAEVVVGTCPDLGTLRPVPQPLRFMARRLSRQLAAAQTIAVVSAGGRTVSLGDLLGAEFYASPAVLFSGDRFHPSAAGYARIASALLPSVCVAAGCWPEPDETRPARTGAVTPVAEAAVAAVDDAGTEVAPADETPRGYRGRWAVLRIGAGLAPGGEPAQGSGREVAS